MKVFAPRRELLEVAKRVVWFRPPAEALADTYHFLAHVMTFGTIADVRAIEAEMQPGDWHEALMHAPPGIFDARSWAYWHLKCGKEVPPLPQRRLL